jgi:membrane protein
MTMNETNEQQESGGGNVPRRFSRPWWRRVGKAFKLATSDFMIDNGPHWAAAIAFYTLLSVFPLLLGALAIAVQFVDAEWAAEQIAANLGDFVPEGEGAVEEIVASAMSAGGAAGVVSVIILLWSGSWVFGALTTALNMAYDVDEDYAFWKRLLFRLAMLLTVGVFMLVAVLSGPVAGMVVGRLPGEPMLLLRAATVVVPFLLMVAAFFLIYWLVPRRDVAWTPALTGAVLATLAFVVSREGFVAYLDFSGEEFDVVYGPLAVGVILVFWAWIVGIILLLGAEITSHLQALLVDGLTPDEVREHHLKRSPDRAKEVAGGGV